MPEPAIILLKSPETPLY